MPQSPTVVDVYTYKIERLQTSVDRDYVKEILSLMWVSRAGVSAVELVAMVGIPQEEFDTLHLALGLCPDGFCQYERTIKYRKRHYCGSARARLKPRLGQMDSLSTGPGCWISSTRCCERRCKRCSCSTNPLRRRRGRS